MGRLIKNFQLEKALQEVLEIQEGKGDYEMTEQGKVPRRSVLAVGTTHARSTQLMSPARQV